MPKPKHITSTQFNDQILKQPWEICRSFNLPKDFYCPTADLFNMLDSRETRRTFKTMSLQDISNLLWFSQRQIAINSKNKDCIKTPCPTAGSLASVQVIVISPSKSAWIYDAAAHKATVLPVHIDKCKLVRDSTKDFFEIGEGTLLLFTASRKYIETYYESPDTLVLREAGILLGIQSLLSEALSYSYCPLGTTAKKWLEIILNVSEEIIIPAGAAVVGRR